MPVPKVFCLLSLLACLQVTAAQQLPVTHAETLSGKAVTLPAPDHAQTLLIAGFSKASSDAVKAWWLQARDICRAHPAIACYEAAVIEDAPSFIRGMIVGSMKRGMEADRRDTFVPITQNEAALKQALSFKAPDDAYLGIFDKTGKLLWRTSGGEKSANSAEIARGFDSIPK